MANSIKKILMALLIVPGMIFTTNNRAYAADDGQGGMTILIVIGKDDKRCPDGTIVKKDQPCPGEQGKDNNDSLKKSDKGSSGTSSTTTQSNAKKNFTNNKYSAGISAATSKTVTNRVPLNATRAASIRKTRIPIIKTSETDTAEELIKTDDSEQNITEELTSVSDVIEQINTDIVEDTETTETLSETQDSEETTEESVVEETTEDASVEESDLQS